MSLRLRIVPGRFAIVKLAAEAEIPAWMPTRGFSAIIRADDELTLVCPQSLVPDQLPADRGWACLRSVGPFEFQTTGIVQALITPLSSNGIGVFVLCTYDGEHLLVNEQDWEKSRSLLQDAGHYFADVA